MNTALLEREQEQTTLKQLYDSQESEFLAVFGRRRIGKTFLIHQYFHSKGPYFEVTGIHKASMTQQLENFATVFADTFNRGKPIKTPDNWFKAFTLLRKALEEIPEQNKVVLFFDELPWFDTAKSDFLGALEHCWNRYLSRMKNVLLIVCGSAASWMIENIVYNTGGLHGRLSKQIHLKPFTLGQTERFLKARHIELPRKELVEVYMAMGGVAKYLTQIKPGQSAAQIINDICFHPRGYLFKEFDRLYSSLFDKYEKHVECVKQLAKHKTGLTRAELLAATSLSTGGTATRILEELEASNFIAKIPTSKKSKSGGLYRLIDEYSLFYLDWIESAPDTSLQEIEPDYWLKQRTSRRWSTWSGYVFEDICLKHVDKIKSALGIAGISTIASTWQNKTSKIDLVIDRADNCINLCEVKFANDEFVIDKAYVKKLNEKKHQYQQATKTKKALFTTLITPFGSKENQNYHLSVQKQLTVNDLF